MLSVSKIKSRTLFYVKDNVAGNEKKKNFQYQDQRILNTTAKEIVAITSCAVYDLFIDLSCRFVKSIYLTIFSDQRGK